MNGAHLHLILNHGPVFGAFIGLGLLAWAAAGRDPGVLKAAWAVGLLSAAFAIAAYATGDGAEETLAGTPGIFKPLIGPHEEAATFALVAVLAQGIVSLLGLIFSGRAEWRRRLLQISLPLSLAGVILMAWTANLGGRIRHEEIRPGFHEVEPPGKAGKAGAPSGK